MKVTLLIIEGTVDDVTYYEVLVKIIIPYAKFSNYTVDIFQHDNYPRNLH